MSGKLLIATVTHGEEYELTSRYTHPSFQMYAEKIGADFKVLGNVPLEASPPWTKFEIGTLLSTYDRVLMVDTDCLIREDCPNLFDLVPSSQLGMFNEAVFVPREDTIKSAAALYNIPELNWNQKYYNTGVIVASRKHRSLFRLPEQCLDHFYEQSYINLCVQLQRVSVFDLHYDYNFMSCAMAFLGLPMHSGKIVHFAGYEPSLARKHIKKILSDWNENPDRNYKRRVWVNVKGGLGDVVASEPVVRKLTTDLYAGQDICITTPWPRVFEHLGVTVKFGDTCPWEDGWEGLKLETRPDESHIIWQNLSQVMAHQTDFASIATLHCMLPFPEKEISLGIKPKDREHLRSLFGGREIPDTVLIHPGVSWESKTFPVSWWQKVINGIAGQVPTTLIGANNQEATGVLDVICPESAWDLRDRTDLGELFALIALSPVLLSNDSAPVHIAGAGDNWIVLIPTAKEPDLILPYRKGSVHYKTKALYKRLVLDDVPSTPDLVYGSFVSGAPPQDWNVYLPEPDEVIGEVVSLYKESCYAKKC